VSAGYRAVQWSPGKRVYDATTLSLLVGYLAVFLGVTFAVRPEITIETALIRAFGTAAFLLLHVILAIGPLARLDPRALPLLWNRRHLGVTMFVCALAHGVLSLVQFHVLGVENPLVSLLATNPRYGSLAQFPFQTLGAAALGILFLMAATSHDFWLAQLTAPVWKALHLGVYAAYALLVAHVGLGALQDERATAPLLLLALGAATLVGLHLAAALRERRLDREVAAAAEDGFVEVGTVDQIPENRAKVVTLAGERVAIFRYDGKLSAISNVCQHQNGPLGEGRILDGCVTCPWHGYQYRPEDGASPPPFAERVPTFRVRVAEQRVLVDPRPLPPGTRVEPATFDPAIPAPEDRRAFFVGYLPLPDGLRSALRGFVAVLAVLFVATAGLLAASQRPLGFGEFEFGRASELVGVLRTEPFPALWLTRDDAEASGGGLDVVPLVGLGKHGPREAVLDLAGRTVRATGTWIRRGPERLLEVAAAEALPDPAPELRSRGVPLGQVRLRGEVVDLKCWLGVMKPGELKSHKACAILCLRGGTPPGFVVRGEDGRIAVLWMVGSDGSPIGQTLLDVVAEPVEVEGEVVELGGRRLLVTDRTRVRRLDAAEG